MPQELINFKSIVANQLAWDADLQANIVKLVLALKTWNMGFSVSGDVGTPSVVDIQLQDANGFNVSKEAYVRVRILNSGSLALSTNATIAKVGGSPELILTSNKDIVVKTDSGGLVQIQVTDATAETVTLVIGPSPLQPVLANNDNSLDITHS